MIDRRHALPVSHQAAALGISRGTVYYCPRPVSDKDLVLMRRLGEFHLEYPFAGARMLRDMLCREGWEVGRKRVSSLMKRMMSAAKAGLSRYWRFYNRRRPHSQFGRQTPDEVYFNVLSFPETA